MSFTELGALREEGAFTIVDTLQLVDHSNPTKRVKLVLPKNVQNANDRKTYSLVDEVNCSQVSIPQGSIIQSVCISANNKLGSDFAASLGFVVSMVKDSGRMKSLATRVSGSSAITGSALNQCGQISFDCRLDAQGIAAQSSLYNAELQSQGQDALPVADFSCLGQNTDVNGVVSLSRNFVGESLPVIPCISILGGSVNVDDFSVTITYC